MKKAAQMVSVGGVVLSLSMFLPSVSVAFDAAAHFEKTCAVCHSIGKGDDIGPDLKDVTKRRKKEWLHAWIKSSQALIQKGDPAAVELFNKFNKMRMADQDLKPEEIDALLSYIEKAGAGPQTMPATQPAAQ